MEKKIQKLVNFSFYVEKARVRKSCNISLGEKGGGEEWKGWRGRGEIR